MVFFFIFYALHALCPAYFILCILYVLHTLHPAYFMSCILFPWILYVLYILCAAYLYPAHYMSCIIYDLHTLFSAYFMSCICYVLHTFCPAYFMSCMLYVLYTLCLAHCFSFTLFALHTLWPACFLLHVFAYKPSGFLIITSMFAWKNWLNISLTILMHNMQISRETSYFTYLSTS